MFFKKNLAVSSAENQLANNRAVRWHDMNEIAYKYSLGPEKSTNLNLYEKLERPIIKTFQKHPGNQVPEAQEIHKVLVFNEPNYCFNIRNLNKPIFVTLKGHKLIKRFSRNFTKSHKYTKNYWTTIRFKHKTRRGSIRSGRVFIKKTKRAF